MPAVPTLDDLCKQAWTTKRGYTEKQKEWLGNLVAPLYAEITRLNRKEH
jgi:hypothetical protein